MFLMGISPDRNQKCVSENSLTEVNSLMNWGGLKYFPVVTLKWDGEFVEEEEDRLL